ncbi:hypothetical protein A2524_03150 [Candidatus Wolfebacteria bacterium RIFOXYD12_FULL_48_21]|uniref:Uncharacterized protein n=1 Tax=Candidatus Wolfebacteria bacterium RIFOXYD1_FULL_48_65 TaxID=1802561 RepID=A0A1F8E3V9_9BACT|nr:MAG: hypothetical protein A2524_03150 [Candidatus Wolfebacteria bacterium RIFOXYD12_FULL_48_21]OGM95513.1 MAG: hypothetical protein A2610_03360 [Candidatus Wolfebacteria bacterium RIFOXYD1_FULL_48_65]OGM97829.1 MAG: hypothetical protein A2532_04580 [Candidatus Wolfebacteria bacterium RIFOXYD2_FULL_48_11]
MFVIPAKAGIQRINIKTAQAVFIEELDPVFRQWTDRLKHGMTIHKRAFTSELNFNPWTMNC